METNLCNVQKGDTFEVIRDDGVTERYTATHNPHNCVTRITAIATTKGCVVGASHTRVTVTGDLPERCYLVQLDIEASYKRWVESGISVAVGDTIEIENGWLYTIREDEQGRYTTCPVCGHIIRL